MTGIACLRENGVVIMGGDSASVDVGCHAINITASPKVFQKGPCLIGYTSSFRMGYLLEHALAVPDLKEDLDYWANIDLVDAIRDCLKEGGYLRTDEGRERIGSFLVAVKNQIFKIGSDLQANRQHKHYAAVGSGDFGIQASLFSTEDSNMAPEARVIKSLQAAQEFNITVREPFHIVSMKC